MTFEDYLDKMGYSWNDFDRTYEMENLIESYAYEKVQKALGRENECGIHSIDKNGKCIVCDAKPSDLGNW